MDRQTVRQMIAKRIAQAVILSNHLRGNEEPFEDYVDEKINTFPSLDMKNKHIFGMVADILNREYGLDIIYEGSWISVR